MPACFGLVVVSLALPGLPGVVVIDTIRLFRPAIPVICLSDRLAPIPELSEPCLPKLAPAGELRAQLSGAMTGDGTSWVGPAASAAAVERAKAGFALSGDLNDAARELARGMPGNTAGGR